MYGSASNVSSPIAEPVARAFALLKGTAEAGRLAHGYVISGPDPKAGASLAVLFLQWLFCPEAAKPCGRCRACRHVEARAHSDVVWVEPESKSRVIAIDQIRELNRFIRETSFEGGWKAAVILEAERFNENSANAFLKSLEEPPPRCLLLLVTGSPQSLLPTIRSRCQHVPVGALAGGASSGVEEVMLEWLRSRGEQRSSLAQAAWIGTLLKEVRERAKDEEKARAGDEEVPEEIMEARVQARAVGARLDILRVVYQWERDVLACLHEAGAEQLYYPGEVEMLRKQAKSTTSFRQLERLDQVDRARRLLEANVPENSVWEAMLPA